MNRIAIALTLATLAGCTDPGNAIRVLHTAGFKDVTITGHRNGCSSGEYVSTGFSAKTREGKPVTGIVCRNFQKTHTIRID